MTHQEMKDLVGEVYLLDLIFDCMLNSEESVSRKKNFSLW